MININEQLLEDLNESEYFLLSMIAKYGKKCCPSNRVLCSKTSWGINKMQRIKKALIAKKLLVSSIRWKKLNGKLVRDSNQYLINTNLLGKYNGNSPLNDSSELHDSELHDSEVVHSEVDDNEVGIQVLKVIIIESKELLKEEEKRGLILKARILELEKELEAIKKPSQLAKEIKVLAEESELPEAVKNIFIEYDKARRKMRKKIKTLRQASSILKRLKKLVDKYGEQKTIDCVNFVLDNAYIEIKEDYIVNDNQGSTPTNDKPQKLDLEAYLLETSYKESEIRRMKESGRLEKLTEALEKESFRLSNISKKYKNESFSTLFLFEALYMELGNQLAGSNPKRKQESLEVWAKKLRDYDQNKGNFREMLRDKNKKVAF